MSSRAIRTLAIIFAISISPGSVLLLYSRTFIMEGLGAVPLWWYPAHYGMEAEMNVSSSCPVSTMTFNGQGLTIDRFNTSGQIVSIVVVSEYNDTLFNQSLVSGEVSGLDFRDMTLTGWERFQDFNVTVFWEGFNATVSFVYTVLYVMHVDTAVYYTMPGFYETQNLGFILLDTGLVVFVVYASAVLAGDRH